MELAGMLRRWRWREAAAGDAQGDAALARTLGVPPLVARLLAQRGLGEPERARRFLEPKLTDLHDPRLLPGATAAAARLVQAVRQRQPIVVYGDYDVDGVAATAILLHTLRMAGGCAHGYIPHRVEEGYGLNPQAIARIARGRLDNGDEGGPSAPPPAPPGPTPPDTLPPGTAPLVLSVDCGITALEPARAARALGVELIITDHHEPDPAGLPDASILVHPRLPGSGYPCGDLCGAGVAFKLAWEFCRQWCGSERISADFRGLLVDLVSLAALGTVADVAPLTDENRTLTVYGLGQIKRTRFAGLNALIDATRLRDEKVSAYHVGFVLGPRLNACGRMGHAREALHLLTDAQADEARRLAEYLSERNDERRATERAILDEARAMVLNRGYHRPDQRAIVLGKEGWHPGVVGIVASRLVDEFHRPVVLLNVQDGEAHGSARSVEGVSIHGGFLDCARFLKSFGGHAMAAGLRLAAADLDAFRAALVQHVNARLSAEDLVGRLTLDADCDMRDVTLDHFQHLQKLAPFGRGNPAPLLRLAGVRLAQPVMRLGSAGQHAKLFVRGADNRMAAAIWFGAGSTAARLAPGTTLDIAFEPVVGAWQGVQRTELHVRDVRVVE